VDHGQHGHGGDRRQPPAYSNRSSVQAGRICGIIATVLTLAILGFVVLVIAVGIGTAA
jgi:hypothetical protein